MHNIGHKESLIIFQISFHNIEEFWLHMFALDQLFKQSQWTQSCDFGRDSAQSFGRGDPPILLASHQGNIDQDKRLQGSTQF